MDRTLTLAMALGIAIWTGCGKTTPRSATEKPAPTVSEKNASAPSAENSGQSADVDAEKPLPDGFPRDMVYPGAKLIMASRRAPTDSMVNMDITSTSADPGQKVLEFYEQKLKGDGWDIRYCARSPEGGQLEAVKPGEKHRVKVIASRPSRETKTTMSVVYTVRE